MYNMYIIINVLVSTHCNEKALLSKSSHNTLTDLQYTNSTFSRKQYFIVLAYK